MTTTAPVLPPSLPNEYGAVLQRPSVVVKAQMVRQTAQMVRDRQHRWSETDSTDGQTELVTPSFVNHYIHILVLLREFLAVEKLGT